MIDGIVEILTETEWCEVTWAVEYEWTKPVPATYLDPPEGGMEITSDPEPIFVTFYFDEHDEIDINLSEYPDFAATIAREWREPSFDECLNEAELDMEMRFDDGY
jgi:hypothetical protein